MGLVYKSILVMASFVVSIAANSSEDFMAFYGVEVQDSGKEVASLTTRENVVLNEPINHDLKGCCEVKFLFEQSESDEIILTVLIGREPSSLTYITYQLNNNLIWH